MQVTPYVHYDGKCEAAFKFYEKELGAKIEVMMRYEQAPPEMPSSPEYKNKIMHGMISIDGAPIMASDAPPGHFQKPQGFHVALQVEDPTDAERRFKALSEGGTVTLPFGKTFFSNGFGMCVDQFGIPWMVNCPQQM